MYTLLAPSNKHLEASGMGVANGSAWQAWGKGSFKRERYRSVVKGKNVAVDIMGYAYTRLVVR